MGYRLQLSAEFDDWLAGLRASDPPAAELAAQALATLAAEGDRLGPPLVIPVPDRLEPAELLSALEGRYQTWPEPPSPTTSEPPPVSNWPRSMSRRNS
jgi:hypothetical protein